MSEPVYVGLDVAKATLDVAVRPSGESWQVPNDDAGVTGRVVLLRALGPADRLRSHRWARTERDCGPGRRRPALVVANPRQTRDFAKGTGQLAKTDRLDAAVLALFAERVRPTPRPIPDEAARLLDAVLTRRRQLLEMLTAEKNRLGFAPRSRWCATRPPDSSGSGAGEALDRLGVRRTGGASRGQVGVSPDRRAAALDCGVAGGAWNRRGRRAWMSPRAVRCPTRYLP